VWSLKISIAQPRRRARRRSWRSSSAYAYPYELSEQPEGGFTVTFPDVPEAITQAETEADAARLAEDALVTALSFYADDAEPVPHPSPALGRRLAYLPLLVAAKLALHDAMLAAEISNVALARRLGVDEKIVRRLRDPLHKSRIDEVGGRFACSGKSSRSWSETPPP
jgi:antitoxin HicB